MKHRKNFLDTFFGILTFEEISSLTVMTDSHNRVSLTDMLKNNQLQRYINYRHPSHSNLIPFSLLSKVYLSQNDQKYCEAGKNVQDLFKTLGVHSITSCRQQHLKGRIVDMMESYQNIANYVPIDSCKRKGKNEKLYREVGQLIDKRIT